MSVNPDNVPDQLIDELGSAVYRHTLRHSVLDELLAARELGTTPEEVRKARNVLVALKLLRPLPDDPSRFAPINPELAAGELAQPLLRQVTRYQQQAGRLREQLLALMPAYLESLRLRSDASTEVITDIGRVRSLLIDAGQRARDEVLVMQPGGSRDPVALNARPSAHAVRGMVDRGVRIRVLYQHTARPSESARSQVRALLEAGAQVRTLASLPDSLIVVDRDAAFVPARGVTGEPSGAAIARAPAVVSFLAAVFEQAWASAVDFAPATRGYGEIGGELRLSILRMLAEGVKDELIARRLGMSPRTCRRHIAEIMRALDVHTRFQAGLAAARAGLLP